MTSRTERFERKPNANPDPDPKSLTVKDEDDTARFSPEEEAALLLESDKLKIQANTTFAAGKYSEAIDTYNKALQACPKYLAYERAVLKSNIAACYVKTEEWKEAVTVAGESLDLLDKAEGKKKKRQGARRDMKGDGKAEAISSDEEEVEVVGEEHEEADEEIISAGAAKAEDTSPTAKRKADIDRIRAKALLRRGKARMEIGSWSSLQGAEEDYGQLSSMPEISTTDKKTVRKALEVLPGRTKAAQEKEMGEMMGKLKELGNGILKPFGLSTDNFQMVKDEKTGGYSMNFNQGGK